MKTLLLPLVAAAATLDAFAAETLSLPALEERVLSSPAVRIALQEHEAAEAKHARALSDLQPKLFVSGSVSSARDPVRAERYDVESTQASGSVARSETVLTPVQERYTRYGAVIGVRIPLFGSRDVLTRNADAAAATIAVTKARQQVVQMEVLKGVRYAYVEAYYRQAQAHLATAFVSSESEALTMLDSRKKAKLLLNADYKALRSGFLTARHDIRAAQGAAADSADKIRLLTGLSAHEVELGPPALATRCRMTANVHPMLHLQTAVLEEKRRALAGANERWLPDSGLTVSQGLNRYQNGSNGSNTAVFLDVQFPLGGPSVADAARKQALADVTKAQIEYDQQQEQYLASIDKVQRDVGLQQDRLDMLEQRLDASKEAERVALLRISHTEGDAVERLVRSRQALYQAYHAQLEATMHLAKAQVDMMGLGQCDNVRQAHADWLQEAVPLLTAAWLPKSAPDAVARGKTQQPVANKAQSAPVLGWYAWHTFTRFKPSDARAFWAQLPRTNRVLLSLNANQIDAVATKPSERQRLKALLASAKQRGISVGLLLGDPGWVEPGESRKLVAIVRDMMKFEFSSIHLDIEESQVAPEKKAAWAPGLIALVGDLRRVTNLPIAVSLHPRDVTVDGLLSGLKTAGAREVALMQYSTNQEKVTGNLASLMRSHRDLQFSLAQSIEPVLLADESYARKPRKEVVAAFHKMSAQLQAEPNFAGIIVQSLDDYLNGALHED